MALKFRVVNEEEDGIYNRDRVREDVQNIHYVSEVKFLVAISEIHHKPHDLMRQQEDGEHDDVSYNHADDSAVAVPPGGAFRIKDSITEIVRPASDAELSMS